MKRIEPRVPWRSRRAIVAVEVAVMQLMVKITDVYQIGLFHPDIGLCCTNPLRDSSRESSVVAGLHEQTDTPNLQDQKLASLQ